MMTTGAVLAATGALFLNPLTASAHCETMDGPVIGDAQKRSRRKTLATSRNGYCLNGKKTLRVSLLR